MPPGAVASKKVLKRKIEMQSGIADITAVDYMKFHKEEWGAIGEARKELRACLLMQRRYRIHLARKEVARRRLERKMAIRMQSCFRLRKARDLVKLLVLQNKCATKIQAVFRGYGMSTWGRKYFQYVLPTLTVNRDKILASYEINRVYRGYRCRRDARRAAYRRNGPKVSLVSTVDIRFWMPLKIISPTY